MPIITAQSPHSGGGGRRIATQSSGLHGAFEASWSYMRPCLKEDKKGMVGAGEEEGERGKGGGKEEPLASGSVDKRSSLESMRT